MEATNVLTYGDVVALHSNRLLLLLPLLLLLLLLLVAVAEVVATPS